jgi:hypothetical protein
MASLTVENDTDNFNILWLGGSKRVDEKRQLEGNVIIAGNHNGICKDLSWHQSYFWDFLANNINSEIKIITLDNGSESWLYECFEKDKGAIKYMCNFIGTFLDKDGVFIMNYIPNSKIILEILQELEKLNIYPRYVYRQDYYDYIFILTRNNSNKLKVPGINIKKEKTYLEIYHATKDDRKEEGFKSYISDKIIHINSGQFWVYFRLSRGDFINKGLYKKDNKFSLEDLVILIKNLNN